MKFQIYKVIRHLFPLFFIFLIHIYGFTQGNSWQVNQKGYWEKINEGLGISYRGNGNKGIVAAGPNSVVAMRRSKAGNAPYHRAEGESFFTILKSTDKGDTWQTLYKDTNDWALGYDIGHPTENVTGWLMRKGYGRTPRPMFKYTTDGGRTINSLEHQVGGGKIKGDEAINVSMYDAKHWAFTTHDEFSLKDHTYVYITHDGGKTWEEKHLKVDPSKVGVYQVVMRTPDKISLFPKFQGDAKTRISTDGGKTWQAYSEMPDKAIGWRFSIEFTGPKTGYVGGQFRRGRAGPDTGKIFKTTDGGRSWDLILNTPLPAPVTTKKKVWHSANGRKICCVPLMAVKLG
jgi:photosystem II stability/assembly factor-like uncharacterized protein